MTSTGYISDLLIQGLGTTLLHSIWQGLVIALLLWVVLYLVPRSNVQLKYWLSVTALTGLLFWTGYTFNRTVSIETGHQLTGSEIISLALSGSTLTLPDETIFDAYRSFLNSKIALIRPYMDTLVLIWFVGVLFFLLRLQGSILYLRRLRTMGAQSVPLEWQKKAEQLSNKLGIKTSVNLLESRLAEVPMVIGHIKPVILIPMGMLTGLTAGEVEAILAHELAHVKRYDYLINIVQTVIESLLFFNPAMWWISHTIRKHREHCCDDIAVRCCGNQMVYANALTNLGAWSLRSPALGMGLFKNKNELLQRIKRLVYPHQVGNQTVKNKLVPIMVLTLTVICLSWYSHRVQAQLMPAERPMPARVNQAQALLPTDPADPTDTIPEIEVEEEVEVLPPMEPWIEEEIEVEQNIEQDVFIELDTVPEFGKFDGSDDVFFYSPDFEALVQIPDEIVDWNIDVAVPDVFVDEHIIAIPDVFVTSPDVRVEVDKLVDVEHLGVVMKNLHRHLDDTTRERIMKALEEQRQALERAKEEQAVALEKAREQLRKSLEAGRPDELTEEEWEMAREQIERAEQSVERAMRQSERALEQALREQEMLELQKNLDRVNKENKIVLRHVQRMNEDRHEDLVRANRNWNRFQYQYHWDSGTEAELRKSLLKDGLIDSYDSDISLSFNKSQININGVKLEGTVKQKYREMLDDMYGEGSTGSLSFSK